MAIAFDQIPESLRVPGTYIEIDPSNAASGTQLAKLLVIGQGLSSGTAAPETLQRVLTKDSGKSLFGRGSQLAAMLDYIFKNESALEIYAISLEDASAATAASCTLLVEASNAEAGAVTLYINNRRIRTAVSKSDSAATIGTNIAAAINADTDCEMSAEYELDEGDYTVVLTAKNKGLAGNGIVVKANLASDDALPEGVVLTIPAITGGAGNPDVAAAIAVMADDQFNYLVMPWTDTSNLAALEAELNSRWGAMRQIDGRAFISVTNSIENSIIFGNSRNCPHVSCMPTLSGNAEAAYLWAAANAVAAAKALQQHPGRPLKGLLLAGIRAPSVSRPKWDVRNQMLFAGLSTHTVSNSGEVLIERQITMYKQTADGFPSDAFLDINIPELLSRIRFEQRMRTAREYNRYMVADDGNEYAPGLPIVTPLQFKGMLIALYQELMDKGWVENMAAYKESLIVERHPTDRNRIQYIDKPDLINQLQVVAGKMQYRV